MHFWRATDAATEPAEVDASAPASAAEEYELSAIDLYMTAGGHRRGWVATNGRRTSDWLNATDPLPVRGATAVEAAEPDTTPPSVDPGGADVELVPSDEILFVIPPPLPSNRHLRLHRRRVHIKVRIGYATIAGQAHIRPGAEVGEHIFRSGRRFVPLTDVEVLLKDDAAAWLLPVVIINSAAVTKISGIEEKQAITAPTPAVAGPTQPAEGSMAAPLAPVPPTTGELPLPAEPALESLASRTTVLLTALELLLAEGVIDIVEFQTKRAGLVAK